jgi:hypothetical protein
MTPVDEEVKLLLDQIRKLGVPADDGSISVKFGVLFKETEDIFEALSGTLRAAKKRKLIKFQGELLLQGMHDNEPIILLPQQDDGAQVQPNSTPTKEPLENTPPTATAGADMQKQTVPTKEALGLGSTQNISSNGADVPPETAHTNDPSTATASADAV